MTANAVLEPTGAAPLLSLRDLEVAFPLAGGDRLQAVDRVSLELQRGRTLGLVGESGCGKSTLGRAVAQLIRPTGGSVHFEGHDLSAMWRHGWFGDRFVPHPAQLRQRIQMVFQDPYSSLNPRMTVRDLVGEPLRGFGLARGQAAVAEVQRRLAQVGLDNNALHRYPHEFSGGQRQRIGIARALAAAPALIICDEPTSALDVSVRAQVLNLLRSLQDEQGFSYLFIAHDLSAVRYVAHRIAVMYLGRLVEVGEAEALCRQPRHPYTRALVSAIPEVDPDLEKVRRRLPLHGELPSPVNPPSGCAFHTRCPQVQDRCLAEAPLLRQVAVAEGVSPEEGDDDTWVACHFVD